jgi:hypothetical protein
MRTGKAKQRSLWLTAIVGLIAALLGTPAVATTGSTTLAGTTVLRGSQPTSMEVVLHAPARFSRPRLVDERVFTVSGDPSRPAGFVIEPVGAPDGALVALQYPVGWGYDGGIDQVVFTPADAPVAQFAPGRYRVWLLTEPGVDVEVAFTLEGLYGEVTLRPSDPAGFELSEAEERVATAAGRIMRQTQTYALLAGGGWLVSGVAFLGDPGTAVVKNLCVMYGGPAFGDVSYASPVCAPRTAFTGRDGMTQQGPLAFAPIAAGGSMAFYTLVTAAPGTDYGTNHTLSVAGEATQAHLGTIRISRSSAG